MSIMRNQNFSGQRNQMKRFLATFTFLFLSPSGFAGEISASQQLLRGDAEEQISMCREILDDASFAEMLGARDEIMPDINHTLEFPGPWLTEAGFDSEVFDQFYSGLLEFADEASNSYDENAMLEYVMEQTGFSYFKAMLLVDNLVGAGYNPETETWMSLNFNYDPKLTDPDFLRRYQAQALGYLLTSLKHVLAFGELEPERDRKGRPKTPKLAPIILDQYDHTYFEHVAYYDSEELAKVAQSISRIIRSLYSGQAIEKTLTTLLAEVAKVSKERSEARETEDKAGGVRGLIGRNQNENVVAANLVNPLFEQMISELGDNWQSLEPNQDILQQRQAIISLFKMVSELRYGPQKGDPITNIHILSNVWQEAMFEFLTAFRYGAIGNYSMLAAHIKALDPHEIPGQADCCWAAYHDPNDFRQVVVVQAHFDRLIELVESSSSGVDVAVLSDISYDQMAIPELSPSLDISKATLPQLTVWGNELGIAYKLLVERQTYVNTHEVAKLAEQVPELVRKFQSLVDPIGLTETEWENLKAEVTQTAESLLDENSGDLVAVSAAFEEIFKDSEDLSKKIEEFQEATSSYLGQVSANGVILRTLESKGFDWQRLFTVNEILVGTLGLSVAGLTQTQAAVQAVHQGLSATTYDKALAERGTLTDLKLRLESATSEFNQGSGILKRLGFTK